MDAAVEGTSAAVEGIKVGDGKALATDGSGSDHTLLYCILGGGAAAALLAAGGYAMMPGEKKKKKRSVKAKEVVDEEAAPLAGGLQMSPSTYVPVPQPLAQYPQYPQYISPATYQPGTYAMPAMPASYQPVTYQQPAGYTFATQ